MRTKPDITLFPLLSKNSGTYDGRPLALLAALGYATVGIAIDSRAAAR